MNYLTHKAGGTLGMLVAFEMLRKHGMLVQNLNPYIQLLVMYPAASWGSTAPDLDRSKAKTADQTPVSTAVEKCLHLMHAKHRSWQTHCIVLTGGLAIALPVILEKIGIALGSFDLCILRLLIYGLTTGILSHLILDAFTPEGIHIIPNMKLSLVPKMSFFSAGGLWEKLVCGGISIASIFMLLYFIVGSHYFQQLDLSKLLAEFIKGTAEIKSLF